MLQTCAIYQSADCKWFAPFLRVTIILGQCLKQTGKCICSHLKQLSLGGGLLYVATKGLEEETHTPPTPPLQMQSNKMNTHTHVHIPPQIFLYLFLEIVRKRNMPSPELHKLMSFSATSQIFHRKAATNTWANKRSVSAFADPADIVYIHIN